LKPGLGELGLRKQGRQISGRCAGGVHVGLQVSARAGGASPLAVCADSAQRHAVRPCLVCQKTIKRTHGCGCRVLDLEVAQHEHTKVPWVVVFDMCTLEVHGACLPDSALWINDEVVADVGPAPVVNVRGADHLNAVGRVGLCADRSGRHAVVVDCDRLDADHWVGLCDDRLVACPLGAWDGTEVRLAGSRWSVAFVGGRIAGMGASLVGPDGAGKRGCAWAPARCAGGDRQTRCQQSQTLYKHSASVLVGF